MKMTVDDACERIFHVLKNTCEAKNDSLADVSYMIARHLGFDLGNQLNTSTDERIEAMNPTNQAYKSRRKFKND